MKPDFSKPALPQLPVLDFEPQWRVLQGVAYGLGQPVMLGAVHIHIGMDPSFSFAALDRAMLRYVHEPLPDNMAPQSPELSLVLRALHWAAAVQRQANVPVFNSGKAWPAAHAHGTTRLHVAVPYAAPYATADTLAWVAKAITSLLADGDRPTGPGPLEADFERLLGSLQNFKPQGVNTFRFLSAAQTLDIPWRQVVPDVYGFGNGRYCRWLESSYTDRTAVIGTRIARDKLKTGMVLRQAGLPAPTHARAASAEQAVELARQFGYPVVVKPADRDQGLGVSADLRHDAMVRAAFHEASKHSGNILVEKHFHGKDFRLTVFNGRLIKATLRIPGGVTGNGRQTVSTLIGLAKQDEHQARRARERGRDLLELDQEARELLTEAGMSPESVPSAGEYVCLRRRANISAGGTSVKVEQPIHPDNRRLAERAADALGLDLAGIDVIMQNISRSWLETGALICEVNGQPQIGIGTSPGIYLEILRELMQGRSRIPVVLVLGTAGRVDQRLMELWQTSGLQVGRASVEGVWQGLERLAGAQPNVFSAAQILLSNRFVDAAIIVMTPAQIMFYGLPFDRFDLVVLRGPDSDNQWDYAELAEMWRMVLPHVAQAIVSAEARPQWLPEAQALQTFGLSVVQCSGDGETMARAAAGLLPARTTAP